MIKLYLGLALSLLLALAVAPVALADTPSPCTQESLDNYLVSGFTCSIGNLDFSDFTYADANMPASQVTVVPGAPPTANFPDGPGFNFQANFLAAGANATTDADIGFVVTAAPGTTIDDIYIDFGNVVTANGGIAIYNEQFCMDGKSDCQLYVQNPGTASTADISLVGNTNFKGPITQLTINKDLGLFAGSASNGLAAVSYFGNEYSIVPEPRGVSIVLAAGLLAGLVIFRRRRVAQS